VSLLKADPTPNPNVHLSIARTLAASGAYKAAQQFHTTAVTIFSLVGPINDDLLTENRVLKWYVDGPGVVVQALAEAVAAERDAAAREIKRLVDAKKPADAARKPEDIQLSAPLLILTIVASHAAGDAPSAAAQLKIFGDRIEKADRRFEEPEDPAGP